MGSIHDCKEEGCRNITPHWKAKCVVHSVADLMRDHSDAERYRIYHTHPDTVDDCSDYLDLFGKPCPCRM